MYSISSISKRLSSVPILVVVVTQLLLMAIVSSVNITNTYLHHKCLTKYGKYKPGSEYEKNLNDMIHADLHYKKDYSDGFDEFSLGSLSVTFQCRGDSYGPNCRSCFATAQAELRKRCPRYKGAIIWYDHCLIKFSSAKTNDYDDNLGLCISNAKNSSNKLDPELLTLFNNLKNIVTTNKNAHNYAAGEKRLQKTKMYLMVHCFRPLFFEPCNKCLSYTIQHFKNCYENKQGARVFMGKLCNFRFELYPFVNAKTSPNYYKF